MVRALCRDQKDAPYLVWRYRNTPRGQPWFERRGEVLAYSIVKVMHLLEFMPGGSSFAVWKYLAGAVLYVESMELPVLAVGICTKL